MRVLKLSCNNCGAPLVVPKRTRFLTCEYCHAQLQVQREGGAAYTEIQELSERTDQLESDVARLKASNELDRLDREWEQERKTYEVRSKNGEASIPTKSGTIAGMGSIVIFMLFWMGFAMSMGGGFIALVGLVVAGAAVVNGLSSLDKAQRYEQRYAKYKRRRRELVAKIRE